MDKPGFQQNLAWRLLARLERLSADSPWAHQASGVRGALLRRLQGLDPTVLEGKVPCGADDLQALIEQGFLILEKAARDLERRL